MGIDCRKLNCITRHSFNRKRTILPTKSGIFLFIGWTHDEIWLADALHSVTRIKISYIAGTIEGAGCSLNQRSVLHSEETRFRAVASEIICRF